MSWERLGAEVRDRRSALGLTQADVTARGGPSVLTLRAIENNRAGRMTPRLRRALETALNWAPGSIDAILAGGAATSVEPTPTVTTAQLLALAEQVLALLKTALAQPNFGTSDPAGAGSIADALRAAREAEAVVLDLMAGLDDAQRGKAIRLLAELRNVVPEA